VQRGLLEQADRKNDDFIFELSPWEAKKVLGNVPREEWLLLNIGGASSIRDFIVEHLVVPPVCIRPSIMLTNSLSNEDDLTIKIKDLVALNRKLSEGMVEKGDDISKVAKAWYLLQSHWSQYINSDAPGLPLQELKHKFIRSFCTRLKGKQGRFRQNLSGKRSNYTARTVISPDPNLRPDQVIVPEFMTKILTIRETVNQYSM
jgi:DNA-directed RNA polymerase III subunit RPC1